MNPVYSPASTGVPFTNTKGLGYPGNLVKTFTKTQLDGDFIPVVVLCAFPAGFPVGYAAAAPAYTPGVYAGANQAFPSGERSHLSRRFIFKKRIVFFL